MFCKKCGNQLPDTADFCPKCGHEFESINPNINQNLNIENNYDKNTILFEVRPSFKFSYVLLPKILGEVIYLLIPTILLIIYYISISYQTMPEVIPCLFIILVVPIFRILFVIGKSFFDKKQYENYVYTFYPDRVTFKDTFMNVSEKELKYKYIREIAKGQTFIQRYFNVGNIILFSNAGSGLVSGIFMINIEDVDYVYKKIKKIANI